MDLFNQLCDEVLSLIEYDETGLLNWGFIEVENDLERQLETSLDKLRSPFSAAWQKAQDEGKTVDNILENLRKRRLIFKNPDGFYRTRYAETMRLLVLLRQRFSYDDWSTGPRLVGDARVQLQRRRYPKRDISYEQLVSSLDELGLSSTQLEILDLLTQDNDGNNYFLAAFQQRAIHTQIRLCKERGEYGVVVGAGTGSGKTKAFYIPALTWLASQMSNDHHVSIMAIYPRNELLKDQFAEAVRETTRLNEYLRQQRKRSISLAAYYGDTPRDTDDRWTFKTDADWIAPFFKCPCCGQDLVWRAGDRKRGENVLHCADNECGYITDPKHILLTREQIKQTPPDILFTTTEMLNQRMARVNEADVFGIRSTPPPRLLLLDEIHTYEGISGANVAYLLRRWCKACGYTNSSRQHSLCIVGLSATLSDAAETFAKLTGLPSHRIYDIHPQENELEEEGIEYNVVIKNDPASGAALLSTAIQTTMLLGRILSPLVPVESNTYAPKIFAFCNRLDTLNRWYDSQRDAEGQNILSQYRLWDNPRWTDVRDSIKQAGQDWHIATLIGHDLRQPMMIGRTSSQSKGVRSDAKLVLATSALEVGFNDPRVGAVIQYQSPYTMASFLQRKGRAGRDRLTRPWTVVITSSYGRDRWAFQHAEMLFNPLLLPIDLPIENYYVRKIQAAYILMDWLADQLHRQLSDLDLWNLFKGSKGVEPMFVEHRNAVVKVLKKLLDDVATRSRYEAYLRDAMGLKGEENDTIVRSLLWGEPRPILLEVVPTLIRQLKTNWQYVKSDERGSIPQVVKPGKSKLPTTPMPEFVPANLFSDLNVPELRLRIGDFEPQLEAFTPTFEEILPGKVTKRYLPDGSYGKNGYWIAVPEDLPDYCPLDSLSLECDPIPVLLEADGKRYRIKRPIEYRLQAIPSNLGPTSTTYAIWRSSFLPKSIHGGEVDPLVLNLQSQSAWQPFITNISVYTQALGTTIQVTRGVIGIQVSHLRNFQRKYKRMMFTENDTMENPEAEPELAGIGYTLDVDGVCIGYHVDLNRIKTLSDWEVFLRSARPLLYLSCLEHDPVVQSRNLTPFELEWLWQVVRSALTDIAIGNRRTLSEASQLLEREFERSIERTLDVLLQGQSVDDEGPTAGKFREALIARLHDGDLRDALLHHTAVLWDSDPDGLDAWLEKQYATSLGAAFFFAMSDLVEDVDITDLRLDIDDENQRFWITEATPGGIGLIAKIVEVMAQQPRRLELQLIDTVHHCNREHLARELNAIADHIRAGDEDLTSTFAHIRAKRDFVSLSAAKRELTIALDRHGIPVTRPLVVAINSKFLRPNSDPDTDRLIADLVKLWCTEEERLGCDIDLRVFAVAANSLDIIREQLDAILKRISGGRMLDDNQRFNLLQSMLWTNCKDSCEDCIKYESRYQSFTRPSRHLLRALVEQEMQTVRYGDPEWEETLLEYLSRNYEATIRCEYDQINSAKQRLVDLLVQPVEIGIQIFFPIVERIERRNDDWLIHMIIREMVGV